MNRKGSFVRVLMDERGRSRYPRVAEVIPNLLSLGPAARAATSYMRGNPSLLQDLHGDPDGRLNPLWCEAFMGFPVGWTESAVSVPRFARQSPSSSAGGSSA
jgi:hypothetical protein